MQNVYFTRHGETVWNVENKICGVTDIALTDRGREQARALGRQLAARVYNLLDELAAQEDGPVLLVAHNGISRVVQSYFYEMTNEEFALFGIKNCELVKYTY